ncbi:hypothetical protein EDB84DRAFT_1447110 [Lactarius hengduanensis]|nr:hypothetical protein EDB84DRAFT_1447110 [Lactarius hengduanensis]
MPLNAERKAQPPPTATPRPPHRPATSRKTLLTRHASSTWHARPQPPPTAHQDPPRRPATSRKTLLTRHASSTWHARPQPPPTPTPPRHGVQYPAARRLTAMPRPCHHRPATSPQRSMQDPADPPRHPTSPCHVTTLSHPDPIHTTPHSMATSTLPSTLDLVTTGLAASWLSL